MTALQKLIEFAKQTSDINPNLLNDVLRGHVKPCQVLNELVDNFLKR